MHTLRSYIVDLSDPVKASALKKALGLTSYGLDKAIKSGILPPPVRYSERLRLWYKSDLLSWLEKEARS